MSVRTYIAEQQTSELLTELAELDIFHNQSVLRDGEVTLLESLSGEYGGVVLAQVGVNRIIVVTEDFGWEVTTPGEWEEDGTTIRAATGLDIVREWVVDIHSKLIRTVEMEIPDDNIHGCAYAASRSDGPNDRYSQYVVTSIQDRLRQPAPTLSQSAIQALLQILINATPTSAQNNR